MENLEYSLEHRREAVQWSHHFNDVKAISSFMLESTSVQWSPASHSPAQIHFSPIFKTKLSVEHHTYLFNNWS